ncbi:hypothetical protein FRC09_008289 [Ceratobasidium sp. 395]|nr:hypothetical protein FRC09_008289 [Ceratobasidium sp. 395]
MIHKVICTYQEQLDGTQRESQGDTLLWKAMMDASRPGSGYEQRKMLVKEELEPAMRNTDTAQNLKLAMNLMAMLVRAEKLNRLLENKLDKARVIEASLCDTVRNLEARTNSSSRGDTRVPGPSSSKSLALQPPIAFPSTSSEIANPSSAAASMRSNPAIFRIPPPPPARNPRPPSNPSQPPPTFHGALPANSTNQYTTQSVRPVSMAVGTVWPDRIRSNSMHQSAYPPIPISAELQALELEPIVVNRGHAACRGMAPFRARSVRNTGQRPPRPPPPYIGVGVSPNLELQKVNAPTIGSFFQEMGAFFWDEKVVALYGFRAEAENELSFNRGEVLRLGMRANLDTDFDWMYCKSEGGHVFCRPCLESLTSSPNCPNCRTTFTADSIRKVVCAQQDQNETTAPARAESEGETLMWQAIQSAVETSNEYEQRKSLVRNNSAESVREAGMSANLIIALDVLRMLLETERRNHSLKDKVDTARAVEESLCDRISMLEAQLSAKTVLLTQVKALQASVRLIKTDTSTIVQHLNTAPPLSPAPRIQTQPQTPVTPDASPNHLHRASTASASTSNRPSILRKPPSQTANNSPPTPTVNVRAAGPSSSGDQLPQYVQVAQSPQQEYFLPHARTPSGSGSGMMPSPRQLMSPPVTPATPAGRPLFAMAPSTPRWSAMGMDGPLPPLPDLSSPRSPTIPSTVPFPTPQIGPSKPTPTQSSASNPFRSPKPQLSPMIASPPRPSPTPAPMSDTISFPTPTPTTSTAGLFLTPRTPAAVPALGPGPRTITTTHPFTSQSPNELSFGSGETLQLLPDSDLSPGKDWVWCRTVEGAVGYAPRSYLRVE